jgi:hypothetical protein
MPRFQNLQGDHTFASRLTEQSLSSQRVSGNLQLEECPEAPQSLSFHNPIRWDEPASFNGFCTGTYRMEVVGRSVVEEAHRKSALCAPRISTLDEDAVPIRLGAIHRHVCRVRRRGDARDSPREKRRPSRLWTVDGSSAQLSLSLDESEST